MPPDELEPKNLLPPIAPLQSQPAFPPKMVLTEVCMNTTMASSITEQHHNKGYQVPNANHRQNYNQRLRVYSTKSMICQLLGAAGAVDAVALVQATRTGWVYPNVNLENPEAGVVSSLVFLFTVTNTFYFLQLDA